MLMDTSAAPAALASHQPGGPKPGPLGLRSRGELPEVFGFHNGFGGVHTSRTMMLADLECLLSAVPPEAARDDFRRAIVEENALGKRTVTTRRKAAALLCHLYALDPAVPIFRALGYFWKKDPAGRPLLALLCAAARDPILRQTAGTVLAFAPGEAVTAADLEKAITRAAPAHFAATTLRTTAQNTASTWTQSGHLQGRRVKRRSRPQATPAATAYALLLGHLAGASGQMLLTTFWARLLDVSQSEIAALASEASVRGWIAYRQAGQVVEVRFPELLTPEEMEVRRGQD